jgi:hypothetical protein
MTTSYFSSGPGSNFGVRRGRGVAKEGRTRRSRDLVEYSVKTGMAFCRFRIETLNIEEGKNRIEITEFSFTYFSLLP